MSGQTLDLATLIPLGTLACYIRVCEFPGSVTHWEAAARETRPGSQLQPGWPRALQALWEQAHA